MEEECWPFVLFEVVVAVVEGTVENAVKCAGLEIRLIGARLLEWVEGKRWALTWEKEAGGESRGRVGR